MAWNTPLTAEILHFGATRGVSNVLLGESGSVRLEGGLLLCVVSMEVIHVREQLIAARTSLGLSQ